MNLRGAPIPDTLVPLLLCLRTRYPHPDPAQSPPAAPNLHPRPTNNAALAIPPDLNWSHVTRLAEQHRLTGHLHTLTTTLELKLPPDQSDRLEQRRLALVARNTFLLQTTAELQQELAQAGINALTVKGPALEQLAYGQTGIRRIDDIDLLLARSDIFHAATILQQQGYRPNLPLTTEQQQRLVDAGWELAFWHPDGSVLVELHTAITPRFFCPGFSDWFTANPCSARIDPFTLQTCNPAAHFVLHLLHAAKHCWHSLSFVADTAALLQNPLVTDSLPQTLTTCRNRGILRIAQIGIELAHALTTLTENDNQPTSALVADRIQALLTNEPAPTAAREIRTHLAARERIRDKLRYLLLLALTPSYSDWSTHPQPNPLRLYLTRPIRLARRALTRPDRPR